jgi:hypothetical protein
MQLQNALPIVRALADGVDPHTGAVFGDNSPYSEPKTLRALFCAVELIEREVAREKRRERLPVNFGKPWSEGEDRTLVTEFDAGIPIPDMARKHQRTHSSIRLRLEKLGKIEPAATPS